MRIKYTTYDTRRDEDIIHLDTDRCNAMFLNPLHSFGSSSHPFSYGKVIGILHGEVGYVGDIGRRGNDYFYLPMEFLWIRWYTVHASADDATLDQVELLPIDASGAHSFVDPLEVMRACHLIPNFNEGHRYPDNQGKSAVAGDSSDWEKYFINRYESWTLVHRIKADTIT